MVYNSVVYVVFCCMILLRVECFRWWFVYWGFACLLVSVFVVSCFRYLIGCWLLVLSFVLF